MAGGANNTTYPNGERGLFANRPPKFLFCFWGAGGHYIPPPPRNANTVPAFRRSLSMRPALAAMRLPAAQPYQPTHRAADTAEAGATMPHATTKKTRPTGGRGSPLTTGLGLASCWQQSLYEIKNLYIHARASAARFSHNVTAAGQQPRKAPAAAIGWAAGVPCAWRAGVRAIGAAVGPAPSGRGPWGTVRGAALRRACVNRRPIDAQQRPIWPRAAGMFQPGIMKTKFFLPIISNNIILYHAGRCCRA